MRSPSIYPESLRWGAMLAQVATQVLTKQKGNELAKPDKVRKLQLPRHPGGEPPPLPKGPEFPAGRRASQVSLGNNQPPHQDWGWGINRKGEIPLLGGCTGGAQMVQGEVLLLSTCIAEARRQSRTWRQVQRIQNGRYKTPPTYLSIVEWLDTLRFSNSFISVDSKRFLRSMVEGREQGSSVFVNSQSKKQPKISTYRCFCITGAKKKL